MHLCFLPPYFLWDIIVILLTNNPTVVMHICGPCFTIRHTQLQRFNSRKYSWNTASTSQVYPQHYHQTVKSHIKSKTAQCRFSWTHVHKPYSYGMALYNQWLIPFPIERDCLRWERALRAEIDYKQSKYTWLHYNLKCTDVITNKDNQSILIMRVPKRSINHFNEHFQLGSSFEFRANNEDRSNKHGYNPKMGVVISRFTDIIQVQTKELANIDDCKGRTFQIRKWATKMAVGDLQFLMKRNMLWSGLPGFGTMLYAYKLNKTPQFGPDPVELIKEINLDTSQKVALAAALNLKRPIVAVHGPAGSGKSRIVLECLRILTEQNKKIFLRCDLARLYLTLWEFYKTTGRRDFIVFNGFDEKFAKGLIDDPGFLEVLKERCVQTDVKHRNAKEYFSENITLYCTKGSNSLMDTFLIEGIHFDVLMLDEANHLNESQTWRIALTTSSCIRLFGDWKILECKVDTEIARKEQSGTSLLRRLDENFGQEVNFQLTRQYRSNTLLQEWPNQNFYKYMAAETDESVKDITLEDLLISGEKTKELRISPLLFVNLRQLDGEWRNWMFEPGLLSHWGEVILIYKHLLSLFENTTITPPQIACYLPNIKQRIKLHKMFAAFCPKYLPHFERINFQLNYGQQVEIVIKSQIDPLPQAIPETMRQIAAEMTRARRQFVLLTSSDWLTNGTDQSRMLLDIFREKGQIIGPNQLFTLRPGQFEQIRNTFQN